ncbi:MAG: hypothetical protein SFU25_08045 [Candidatus Caenarcaniphilales bacterium]|nr:hypothetical protein [Candidatus Caenarcaniphilales bacterium]
MSLSSVRVNSQPFISDSHDSLTSLSNPNTPIKPNEIRIYTAQAIRYLDGVSQKFSNLSCSVNDDFCWWFLLHVKIGEKGSRPMLEFARSVPIFGKPRLRNNIENIFPGESHVFQYPAYWLLKGVPTNTLLRNGQTIEEYILNRDWERAFTKSSDKEPSWYWIGKAFYPQLPAFEEQFDPKEVACLGSHFLVGLSQSKRQSPVYTRYLEDYYYRLKQAMRVSPEIALKDPFKADLLMHYMETFCLAGRPDLIDKESFFYTLKFMEAYTKEFNREFAKSSSINSFVKADSEMAYATAEMLGHFRNGLRVCLNRSANPLNRR